MKGGRTIIVTTAVDKTVTPTKYYQVWLTRRDVNRYDNCALVSCGLTVGEGSFKKGSLLRLIAEGRTTPITEEFYKHSGCQSSCKLRGDKECRW